MVLDTGSQVVETTAPSRFPAMVSEGDLRTARMIAIGRAWATTLTTPAVRVVSPVGVVFTAACPVRIAEWRGRHYSRDHAVPMMGRFTKRTTDRVIAEPI